MNNDNPNKSETHAIADLREKKAYKAPSFRFESVFEVSALACGKTGGTQNDCIHTPPTKS
jgi:hypothetical protein